MTPARALTFTALAALALGSLATAARGDVVTTTDELVLEGSVEKAADGSLTVRTASGVVRLAASAVKSVEAGEGPRAPLEREALALKASDVDGWYALALRSEAKGASDLAARAYRAAVLADPDHAAARRALGFEKSDGAWVTTAEARRKSGLVFYGGTWILPLEAEAAARAVEKSASASKMGPADDALLTVMRTAATGEPALAKAAELRLLRTPQKERSAAAATLLYDGDARVRTWACALLGSLGDEMTLRPLLLSAERDRDPDVRRAAITAAAAFGNDDVAIPFVKALDSIHPGIVANAARALGVLGDARAIGYVVKHIVSHGPSARAYVAFLSKVSYIRDYDVEIAQAANIANPIVGQVVDGIVLDAKVLDLSIDKTVIETVLYDTFNTLAGTNLHTPDDVLAWYRAHAGSLRDFPEKPDPRRITKGVPHPVVPETAPGR